MELLNCPFCGGEAEIKEKKTQIRLNHTKTTGANMEFIEERKNKRGKTIYYLFEQTKYNIACKKTNCPCHNQAFIGLDKDEMIRRWNRRV